MLNSLFAALAGIIASSQFAPVASQCIADEEINGFFTELSGADQIPLADSCCQFDVCGLPCPEEVDPPHKGKFSCDSIS